MKTLTISQKELLNYELLKRFDTVCSEYEDENGRDLMEFDDLYSFVENSIETNTLGEGTFNDWFKINEYELTEDNVSEATPDLFALIVEIYLESIGYDEE